MKSLMIGRGVDLYIWRLLSTRSLLCYRESGDEVRVALGHKLYLHLQLDLVTVTVTLAYTTPEPKADQEGE